MLLIEIHKSIGSKRRIETPTFCTSGCAVAVILVFETEMRITKIDDDGTGMKSCCDGKTDLIPAVTLSVEVIGSKDALVVPSRIDVCKVGCFERREGPSLPPPIPPLLVIDCSPSNPNESESPETDPSLPL